MNLFQSKTFNAMEASLRALEMQSQVIAQNIANSSTPKYKAKTLVFSEVLGNAQAKQNGRYAFKAKIITDDSTSARLDGNNVDLDQENIKATKMKYQQAYLTQKISGQFNNIRKVLENGPR